MAGDEAGKKGGDGASSKEKGDNAETIAAMPWQREGGRLSRPPSAQRVHSVSGGPQANARAVSDDDETPITEQQQDRGRTRTGLTAHTLERTNLQVGAPPGVGVQQAVTASNWLGSSSSASSSSSSPMNIRGRSVPAAELYPSITPLTESVEQASMTGERLSEKPHVGDLTYLDEDFQECRWIREQDGASVLVRAWATRQNDRAVVYTAGGGIWSGTIEEYAIVCPRIAEEVRMKQDARANLTLRRIEVAKKGAEQFLRRFRRETGGLPTRSTWRNAWQGELDAGGRQIVVRLKCHLCGMERILGLGDADAIPTAFQARGFSCGLLQDVKCGETAPGRKGEPLELRQARGLSASEERPSLDGVKSEGPEEPTLDEDIEITGFSTAAKQFYKARGPQLQTPVYRGESSEVDLLAWKRGIEKYFETYGVTRQREKVSLAADLLEGEAAK